MIGVSASEFAIMLVKSPAHPAASSSLTIAVSSAARPPPPYSCGTLQLKNPA